VQCLPQFQTNYSNKFISFYFVQSMNEDSTEELHQHALSLMKLGNFSESQRYFDLCLNKNEKKFEFGIKKHF
jgi:hypothetical protein